MDPSVPSAGIPGVLSMAFVVMLLAEFVLYWKAPALLCRLAFLPAFKERTFELPSTVMAEMPDDESAGYRRSAKRQADLRLLAWPRRPTRSAVRLHRPAGPHPIPPAMMAL